MKCFIKTSFEILQEDRYEFTLNNKACI